MVPSSRQFSSFRGRHVMLVAAATSWLSLLTQYVGVRHSYPGVRPVRQNVDGGCLDRHCCRRSGERAKTNGTGTLRLLPKAWKQKGLRYLPAIVCFVWGPPALWHQRHGRKEMCLWIAFRLFSVVTGFQTIQPPPPPPHLPPPHQA